MDITAFHVFPFSPRNNTNTLKIGTDVQVSVVYEAGDIQES